MADSGSKAPANSASEVAAMSETSYAPSGDTIADSKDESTECGSMRISESEVSYVGGDHWAILLDGIADLKVHLDREEQLRVANTPPNPVSYEHGNTFAQPKSGYAMLLYGGRQLLSQEEILSKLPPKAVVDRHISRRYPWSNFSTPGKLMWSPL
ncbi:unnamed protein product [Penicillium pancosmium]